MRVKIKNSMITHYDLFAGIGGFSLALDTVFHEEKINHIFCEWEAFPTEILKKHWPDGTYYGDIADLVADTEQQGLEGRTTEVGHEGKEYKPHNRGELRTGYKPGGFTIVTGGFPCQPFSHAGRRKGTADDRYKWPEMFAVIRNVRPDWVIAENVRGLVTWNDGMVLETVCADLESEGYEVQPIVIPAVAVGAPHRRDRVWIVAYHKCARWGAEQRPEQSTGQICRQSHGDSHFQHVANNRGAGLEEARSQQQTAGGGGNSEQPTPNSRQQLWQRDWREVAFATCYDGVDDGLPRWMDGTAISASRHRKERLKACGNAIVPQVAMEIFRAMKTEK